MNIGADYRNLLLSLRLDRKQFDFLSALLDTPARIKDEGLALSPTGFRSTVVPARGCGPTGQT
jgi:hypothetical protein